MDTVKPQTAQARRLPPQDVGVSHLQICLTEFSDFRGLELPHLTPSSVRRKFIGACSERGVAGERIAYTISGALRSKWSPCVLSEFYPKNARVVSKHRSAMAREQAVCALGGNQASN